MSGKAVTICAVPQYDDSLLDLAVERIFTDAPCTAQLGGHSRVLLKPNLLAKHAPEAAVTTHPAVVRAVANALKRRGVQHITLADSAGGLYNSTVMQGIYKQSGLAAVCSECGIALCNDFSAAVRKTDGVQVREFNLIAPLHEADFIINLPKMKTHAMTGMTCAVKNLFGTIPGLQKAELHLRFPEKERFGQMLVDLCETVRPQLHVVDAIIGMEGDGPAGGTPRAIGLLLGGEDAYAVDLAVCHLAGIDPMQVPYLQVAHSRGLCANKVQTEFLQGDVYAFMPLQDFRLPESYASIDFSASAPRALRWAVPGVEKLIAPRPKIDAAKCIGCGKCAEICPGHTIVVAKGKAKIKPKDCIRCFCCHEVCPVKAIAIKRFGIFHF